MPKVQQTHRKEPERLEAATKELLCFHCGQPFTKSYNYRRHLCNVHGVHEHGEPSSASDSKRYGGSTKKEEQKRSQGAPAQATTAAPEPQPSTSKKQRPTGIEARPKKKDRQSSYPEPASGPEHPLTPDIVAAVRRKSKSQPRAASAHHTPAQKREEPEVAAATTRKPIRPVRPSCRRVRAAVSAPPPFPKRAESSPVKRRVEMTPSVLAKKVAHSSTKSSREIAVELASSYAMPSGERRTNENLVRAMRAANREFCSHLRRALALNRSKKVIVDFLTKVEEQCQEAERHDSDEFV